MGRLRKNQITGGKCPPENPETKVCDPLDFYAQLKIPQITYTKLRLKCNFRNTLWN